MPIVLNDSFSEDNMVSVSAATQALASWCRYRCMKEKDNLKSPKIAKDSGSTV